MRVPTALLAACLTVHAVVAADGPQLPPAAERSKATVAVVEVFGADADKAKTPAAQSTLAARVRKAAETEKEPAVRWAMLEFARGLATQAGDTKLLTGLITELDTDFGSGPASRIDSAEKLVKSGKTGPDILDFLFGAADAAMDADDYAAAGRIAAGGEAIAAQVRDPAAARYFAFVKARAADLGKKLAAAKDDAEALARFQFFEKRDVRAGIPLLAGSKDQKLVDAALKDAKAEGLATTAEVVAAGDAWWQLAEAATATDKLPLMMAAWHAYARAIGDLTGLEKAKVDARIEKAWDALEAEEAKNGQFLAYAGTWEYETRAGAAVSFVVHRSGRVVFENPGPERPYLARQGKTVVLRYRKELTKWSVNGDALTIEVFTPDGAKPTGTVTARRK